MGYTVNADGYIKFKEAPNQEIKKWIEDFCGDGYYNYDTETYVGFGFYGKYIEDMLEEGLFKTEPFVSEGEISFCGEDGQAWRVIFKDGKWIEENGHIYYDSEVPPVKKEEVPEFIGQIIDLFEDIMEELNITNAEETVFAGKTFDEIYKRLDKMMKRWNIYET